MLALERNEWSLTIDQSLTGRWKVVPPVMRPVAPFGSSIGDDLFVAGSCRWNQLGIVVWEMDEETVNSVRHGAPVGRWGQDPFSFGKGGRADGEPACHTPGFRIHDNNNPTDFHGGDSGSVPETSGGALKVEKGLF